MGGPTGSSISPTSGTGGGFSCHKCLGHRPPRQHPKYRALTQVVHTPRGKNVLVSGLVCKAIALWLYRGTPCTSASSIAPCANFGWRRHPPALRWPTLKSSYHNGDCASIRRCSAGRLPAAEGCQAHRTRTNGGARCSRSRRGCPHPGEAHHPQPDAGRRRWPARCWTCRTLPHVLRAREVSGRCARRAQDGSFSRVSGTAGPGGGCKLQLAL